MGGLSGGNIDRDGGDLL